MLIIQKGKCKTCGAEMEVTNKEFTKCINGCCNIKANNFGYRYSTVEGEDGLFDYVFKERKEYFEDGDFVKIDKELYDLIKYFEKYKCDYDTYRKFKGYFENYLYEEKDDNNKKFISSFEFCYYKDNWKGEQFKIQIYLLFKKENIHSNLTDEERIIGYKDRLRKFISLLDSIGNGDIDITDVDFLYNNENLLDYDKNQKELYDYDFYF